MSYTIAWDDETHTIVRQLYQGQVGRLDFESMVQESVAMLESVTHSVDIVIEWHGDRHIRQDLSMIYGAVFAEKHVPSNQRFLFVINMPPLYRILARVLQRSAPRALGAIYFVDSMEEVYRLRAYLLEAGASSV
jgi:hypothetical protein